MKPAGEYRLLSALREYFIPRIAILAVLAKHPTRLFSFEELRESTGLGEMRLNRGLRKLAYEARVIARIEPGPYPNQVGYQIAVNPLSAPQFDGLRFPGSYSIDDILDRDLGREEE